MCCDHKLLLMDNEHGAGGRVRKNHHSYQTSLGEHLSVSIPDGKTLWGQEGRPPTLLLRWDPSYRQHSKAGSVVSQTSSPCALGEAGPRPSHAPLPTVSATCTGCPAQHHVQGPRDYALQVQCLASQNAIIRLF